MIGDRCLEYRSKVDFVYDLGEAWKDFTGLPFVFAAWISNKKLPAEFVSAFNEANQRGVEAIEKVAAENIISGIDSMTYFRKNISYIMDEGKRKGLKKFLDYMGQQEKSFV